jgi:hypothetical protein
MHGGGLTWISPAFASGGRVAQHEYDESEARSDQKGTNPIYALIFLRRRLVFVDGKESQDHANEGNTREQIKRTSPCLASTQSDPNCVNVGVYIPYLVSCVRTLPKTAPKTAPIGAPEAKVANAKERAGPGGNA